MVDESEPAEVEIIIEGDLAAAPATADGDASQPSFHDVGGDRLGAAVGSVSDAVAELRDRRAEAVAAGMTAGSGRLGDLLLERTAQVVQATRAPAWRVIELLARDPELGTPTIRLTGTRQLSRQMAVFDGHLRMVHPRTRRRIELRVYPTASGNLTVLELLPRRVWMPQTKRYLRAGVPAITSLVHQVNAALGRDLQHPDRD